ncbi:MAG: DNA replication protein [Alphaproteobacteria bacterium]|nr:DNA replication protein [Alphaproteobacteria bacterium]
MSEQLPLTLPHLAAMGVEDFLVAECNRAALGWVDRWPDWPGPALVIYGPAGCGKTHLAHLWRRRSGAAFLPARVLGRGDTVALLGGGLRCVLEAADAGVDELALLGLYNRLREAGGSMLLTASRPPHRWGLALADLSSRLIAAPAAAISGPDDALMRALIQKLFADRQLVAPEEAIAFLIRRIERSFDAARRIVAAVDRASLASGRPVTLALVRGVLDAGA